MKGFSPVSICTSRVSGTVTEYLSWKRIIDVPNFRVAHETIVQTDVQAVSCNIANMALAPELVHVLCLPRQDSVSLLHIGVSPSIMDTDFGELIRIPNISDEREL